MLELYLTFPAHVGEGSRGLFWPAPTSELDPALTDLVEFQTQMDDWSGDAVVAASDPWFLARADLCEAIRAAGLTGLRIGNVADLSYSEAGEVLAALGELAARRLPTFHIVVPEHPVAVSALGGDDDGIGRDDDLRYDAWTGDDFTYSRWGPVLTPRAVELVRELGVIRTECWQLSPG